MSTFAGRRSIKRATAPSPRAPRGRQTGQVYEKLRALVQDGVLQPGDRIIEATIAQKLGVSRTPVRDAIHRLEAEGLIGHEARAGLVVARLDRSAVAELYEMREVLEGTAARLFTRHASEMEVQELVELVERERGLQGNPEELAAHNLEFHHQIHRGARNRFLEKALLAVNSVRWILGPTQMLTASRAAQALMEHHELVQAIEHRNADLAESHARKHLRSAHLRRMSTLFPRADD